MIAIVFCAVVLVPVGALVAVIAVFCASILVPGGALDLIAAVLCAVLLAPRGALLSGVDFTSEVPFVDGGRVVEGPLVVSKALRAFDGSRERP